MQVILEQNREEAHLASVHQQALACVEASILRLLDVTCTHTACVRLNYSGPHALKQYRCCDRVFESVRQMYDASPGV